MFHLTLELDPARFAQQLSLARSRLRARGVRVNKARDRMLVGYVDGVFI